MVSLPPPPFNVSSPPAPIITLALSSPVRVSLEDPPPIFIKLEALPSYDDRLKETAL